MNTSVINEGRVGLVLLLSATLEAREDISEGVWRKRPREGALALGKAQRFLLALFITGRILFLSLISNWSS